MLYYNMITPVSFTHMRTYGTARGQRMGESLYNPYFFFNN